MTFGIARPLTDLRCKKPTLEPAGIVGKEAAQSLCLGSKKEHQAPVAG